MSTSLRFNHYTLISGFFLLGGALYACFPLLFFGEDGRSEFLGDRPLNGPDQNAHPLGHPALIKKGAALLLAGFAAVAAGQGCFVLAEASVSRSARRDSWAAWARKNASEPTTITVLPAAFSLAVGFWVLEERETFGADWADTKFRHEAAQRHEDGRFFTASGGAGDDVPGLLVLGTIGTAVTLWAQVEGWMWFGLKLSLHNLGRSF